MEGQSLFPCWGKFERMGHDVTYGFFEVFDGMVLSVLIPGLNARNDEYPETQDVRRLVQLGGPAFYGFEVLDEATVYARLEERRPWSAPSRRALTGPVEEEETDDPWSDQGEE